MMVNLSFDFKNIKNMMVIKKIENMNYYEILNLEESASQKEIERAYHLGKSTYSRDSLAHYNLLSEKERRYILKKIEDAYQNLKDPQRRNLYNLKILKKSFGSRNKAYFRQSTQKLEIEDAEEKKSLWKKFKYLLLHPRKK